MPNKLFPLRIEEARVWLFPKEDALRAKKVADADFDVGLWKGLRLFETNR